jgi:two-component system, cell cycle response regulator
MAVDLDSLGDRLLEACAKTLQKTCRSIDIVTRPGGDEFIVILPNTHFAGSVQISERVWREIRGTTVEESGTKLACEASIGVACFPSRDITSVKELLRFAHAALARAKAEGRGKICLYQFQGYLFQPQ